MTASAAGRAWVCVVVLAAGGCGGSTERPADTGARDAALRFGGAVAREDWEAADEGLHEGVRGRPARDEFVRLARQYRRGVGFEPSGVQVRSCEEQGDEAKAHVVFSGQAKSGARQFRDSLLLRR